MQTEAPLELAVKFLVTERNDARGLGAALGPYQRRALARQRQDRERTCGQEMLFGAAPMIALVADGDDDAGLVVLPAMGGNAGALAQFRPRAIGGDQEARRDHAAVAECHLDAVGTRIVGCNRSGAQIDALGFRTHHQRIDQAAVLDHMRKGLARGDIAGKVEEHRTGGVLELRIGDDHVEDRLRLAPDGVPGADRLEQAAAGGHDRGGAGIAARPRAERGIGDDDGDLGPEPLAQRQGECKPCKRAATDDNATLYRHTKFPGQFSVLLADLSWAKQCSETRAEWPLCVIPGRANARTRNPEVVSSGFPVHRHRDAPE
ncbi:hypothetical protein ABIA41_002144 [Bradyrhizobium sp. USDA 313]